MSHSVAVTENETVTDVNALVKALVDETLKQIIQEVNLTEIK